METAKDQSQRKDEDDVQGTVRQNIRQIHINIRKGQVYMIGDCILRRIVF